MTAWTVFVNACIVALFQGFGSIPLYVCGDFSESATSYLTIAACGMMVGCGYLLMASVEHGEHIGMVIGVVFGWLLVWCSSLFIRYIQPNMTQSNQQIIIVILTMTFHSLGEGSSIGVAAGSSNDDLSWNVILSLALHNIPEGLATCLYLVGRGMSKHRATLYSISCDIPLPLTAVPAFLFVDTFTPLLSFSLGFAAGAMFYISFCELMPECLDKIPSYKVKERAIMWTTFLSSIAFVYLVSD
mmetsp:Transcript_43411/g.69557  ORF Transcript_43411/g.69557 Transcript_43411/m.69557 type:complete len:243 (-) Transcript_43411:36-764(-)